MARRDSPLNDLFDIAATFPWWVGVGIAIAVFIVLHSIAGTTVAVPTGSAGMGDFAVKSLGITLAKFGQWILPTPLLLGAAASAYQRRKRAQLHAEAGGTGGQAAIEGMSWQAFEMLVGEAFRQRGFSALETGGGGADGGVDLVLSKGREKYLVQCKQWRALKVGVTIVHELYGVMAAQGATGGFVVTSGTFTADAIDFAKGRNIDLIDGPKLGVMIRSATRAGEGGLASPMVGNERGRSIGKGGAPQGSAAPKCPRCGEDMVKRIAKQGSNAGKSFWGCSAFPQCRGIRVAE